MSTTAAARTHDVAVIIPAHDAAATIAHQLAALNRALPDGDERSRWQIVVVDDASTDATRSTARAAATAHRLSLRILTMPANRGPSAARNRGVAATTAPLLLFCDADDEVEPGWAERMVDGLDRHPVVTGRLRSDAVNDPLLAASRGAGDRPPDFLGLFPSVSSGCLGVTREAWAEIGGFDERLSAFEDAEWAGRAARAGLEVGWVADAVVHYRFRTATDELWSQGRRYGEHRPLVARRWYEATGQRPSRVAGWRSWLWLLAHLPDLRSERGRARWAWVAGNRVGGVVGSVRHRFLLL